MNNEAFWKSVNSIIRNDFKPTGIETLDEYAELFARGKLLFKRFSPQEQHGCSAGGPIHVVATILAGAKVVTNQEDEGLSDFKRELKQGTRQAEIIENWARKIHVWIDNIDEVLTNKFGELLSQGGEAKVYDNGITLIKSIGLDYFILPSLALDRISLHNAYFPETTLSVVGFGMDETGEFKIIVRQPFIIGNPMSEVEIEDFVTSLGFELRNPSNWTYTTPSVYLSDLHDENVIKSDTGRIFVIDCDIRINTPDLRLGGIREATNEVEFV